MTAAERILGHRAGVRVLKPSMINGFSPLTAWSSIATIAQLTDLGDSVKAEDVKAA